MNIFDVLIVQPIFNLLIGLYAIIPGGDFGVAIIIFTIIVRFLLYPLTKSMLHQTRVMRKLQPELVKIRKRNKKNKQLAGVEMMELYKKHGINPFRPIGILLIQLPIFIGLFLVIRVFTDHQNDIAKYTYDFLENIAPIKYVIENATHFSVNFLGIIDLTKTAFHDGGIEWFLIILAVVAGVTQYIMSKQTTPQDQPKRRLRDIMAEAAEGKEADQAEMNAIVMAKMMKVLPFFMFVVMVSLPGAIALYYATSNIVAVFQQAYLIRRDEEEMETIADKAISKQTHQKGKKATHKAREREKKARKATVTRIVANDSKKGKS